MKAFVTLLAVAIVGCVSRTAQVAPSCDESAIVAELEAGVSLRDALEAHPPRCTVDNVPVGGYEARCLEMGHPIDVGPECVPLDDELVVLCRTGNTPTCFTEQALGR